MNVAYSFSFMKEKIFQAGTPMEIALNFESKRKTAAAMSFRDKEREFGEDAVGVGLKRPPLSYQYILHLIGTFLPTLHCVNIFPIQDVTWCRNIQPNLY